MIDDLLRESFARHEGLEAEMLALLMADVRQAAPASVADCLDLVDGAVRIWLLLRVHTGRSGGGLAVRLAVRPWWRLARPIMRSWVSQSPGGRGSWRDSVDYRQ